MDLRKTKVLVFLVGLSFASLCYFYVNLTGLSMFYGKKTKLYTTSI